MPPSCHEREREASRKQMALYRAKIGAEKRAQHLKCLLGERDRAKIEARGSGRRRRLLREWFDEHDLDLDPAAVGDEKALRTYMTKIELHKIELQVAEFEISIIEDGGDYGSGGDCRGPMKESAKADTADSKALVGGTGQEVGQLALLNVEIVKKVAEEGPKIGSADPQACGGTEQVVHKYQLTQEQSVLSNQESDRLTKKSEKVFKDIAESKVDLASTKQVGADPSVPSNRELGGLLEGDAKPSGVEARETPSDAADADIRVKETLDAGQEGGGVDELLAARRDDVLPPEAD